MSIPIPVATHVVAEHPIEFIDERGGFVFRGIILKEAGHCVGQHKHETDHVTLVASGSARLWVNGVFVSDFDAFDVVEVKAGDEHYFQALKPDTRLVCLFDASKYKGD